MSRWKICPECAKTRGGLSIWPDVRIWAPARAGVALDRRYLGGHHLFCPENPHPRAVCADLLGRLDLAGLAGQFPNGPRPRLAALTRAAGRLGADHIRARLYKL
mgnify:CR=1 FL=1